MRSLRKDRDLRELLYSIDHRGYPAYKETTGHWQFPNYILHIDHVQGDPFASPSHITLEVSGKTALFPSEYLKPKHRRIALQDYLCRRFSSEASKYDRMARGSGKSGGIFTVKPGQEVMERTACRIDPENGTVFYRLEVGFPARGRTISADELINMLFDYIPKCVSNALIYSPSKKTDLQRRIDLSDDQQFIREQLRENHLSAFIADGAVLPRVSGVSSLPMKDAHVFKSPDSLKVEFNLPHKGLITGLGIKNGITLIVGGGYHGKSTLLRALETGVYNHIEGDGREYVITDDSAVKIRSEDGRSVHSTDISIFIKNLPDKRDTVSFSTEDASGSTSQAANVIEAIESGSKLLLIDEDTCATNFMVRDALMQEVILRDDEPITPFIEKIRPMYESSGISTILVAGSFGSFFHIADTIIQMDKYVPVDITEKAKETAKKYPIEQSLSSTMEKINLDRVPQPIRHPDLSGRVKTKTMGLDSFLIDHENVIIRGLEQLMEGGQSTALARAVIYLSRHGFDGSKTLKTCIDSLMEKLDKEGPDVLCDGSSYVFTGLTLPRRQEIFACLNRCRFLNIKQKKS